MNHSFLQGDSLAVLKTLAPESVQCVVTSPPYWNQRDYQVEGQVGLEKTPDEYIARMVAIFQEVRRVLKKNGTLWLNIGDSYAAHPGQRTEHDKAGYKQSSNRGSCETASRASIGLKPKDLVMMPARVALALQADGWYLRSDIIWAKNNPMPESVRDRPTTAHEHLFLFAKSEKYYYNHQAIMEPCASGPSDVKKMLEQKERIGGLTKDLEDPLLKASSLSAIGRKRAVGGTLFTHDSRTSQNSHEDQPCLPLLPNHYKGSLPGRSGGPGQDRRSNNPRGTDKQGALAERTYTGFNSRYDEKEEASPTLYRNARSIWTINTQPFPGAHFAVMPQKLVEPCILAGSDLCDTILDPFSGAGTVALVANKLGRNAIGIELNPAYIAMAEARLAKALSNPPK